MKATHYDILFLVDSGIGNALEAFYALEYCLENQVKAAMFLCGISRSFQDYARECYGDGVILRSVDNIETTHLVHSFTCQKDFSIPHRYYFYADSGFHSSKYCSETELSLNIVRALYPSDFKRETLKYLKADFSERLQQLAPETKTVLYPGSTAPNSYKRWPYFTELAGRLGNENVIFVGGKEDLNFSMSYIYPPFVTRLVSQPLLNRKVFWTFLKRLNLLQPYSHYKNLEKQDNAFFQELSWPELVALFQHCKNMVGNDGGIAHLAAAAGAQGVVLFGATSVAKNRAYNPKMKPLQKNYPCQPCQFAVGGIPMSKFFINCPYQVKCLQNITVDDVLKALGD